MQTNIKKFFTHMIANHSILFFASIITIIVFMWTIWFYLAEWRSFFNSFYFTTVTMATVGYGDMAPMTYSGKILAIFYGFMGAPLFVGLTSIFLQTKFQNIVKNSIHNYHKEIKDAEHLAEELKKENEIQKEKIEEIKEEMENIEPKPRKKRRKFWK